MERNGSRRGSPVGPPTQADRRDRRAPPFTPERPTVYPPSPLAVVITSAELASSTPDELTLVASTMERTDAHGATIPAQMCTARFARLRAYFTGTGDLLAALLLAWLSRRPADLVGAIRAALSSMQHVLRRTAERAGVGLESAGGAAGAGQAGEGAQGKRTAASCRQRELRLVENIRGILDPPIGLLDPPVVVESL